MFSPRRRSWQVFCRVFCMLKTAISWANPVTISGDTDVFTAGTLNYAYDLSNTSATVNGVSFFGANSTTSLGADVSLAGFDGGNYNGYLIGTASPATSLTANYQNVLTGGDYSNNGTSVVVTLNNLTSGHQFAVQFWVDDSRSLGGGRYETVYGGGNTVSLAYPANSKGALGQYSTGIFLARGSSQPFTLQGNVSTQMNALQVHDVTNLGYWTGTDPTNPAIWDNATSNNFAGNLYNALLAATTFSAAQGSLNGVTFADVYWDNGATHPVTQNNITIATGGVSTGSVYFQNSAVPYTVSSSDSNGISGSTAVYVAGGGTVTLLGTHSYTGTTTIGASSTLNIGNGVTDASITNSAAITNNGSLVFNPATSATYSNAISGIGSLTMAGQGMLTLTGNLSYTGATVVNGGTLAIANAVNGPITVNAGGAITTTDGANFWTSGAGIVLNGGTLASGAPNSWWGSWLMNDNIHVTANSVISATGFYSNGGGFNVDAGATLYVTGTLTDTNGGYWTNSVIKTGSGSMVLMNANTYHGATYINQGVLSLANSAALSGGGTLVFGGGTLQYTASNQTDYSDNFSTANNQPISIDLNGQSVQFATQIQGTGTSLTLNSTIPGGVLNLTGQGSYTGGTVINSGVRLENTNWYGVFNGDITVNSGGQLYVNANNVDQTNGLLTLNGGDLAWGGWTAGSSALYLNAGVHVTANSTIQRWHGRSQRADLHG